MAAVVEGVAPAAASTATPFVVPAVELRDGDVDAAGETGRDALRFGALPPFTIFATKDFVDGEWDGRAFGACTSVEEKRAGAAAGDVPAPLACACALDAAPPGEGCWWGPAAGLGMDSSCACCGVPLWLGVAQEETVLGVCVCDGDTGELPEACS